MDVIVGEGGTNVRTTNGGETWTRQTTGRTDGFSSVSFGDVNNGWIVGAGWNGPNYEGTILKTTNGGITWTTQISGTVFELLWCILQRCKQRDCSWAMWNNFYIHQTEG